MLRNISLGTYYPGKSLVHRLQARTKLLALLCIALTVTIAAQRQWHFVPFIVLVVLLGISIWVSAIAPRELWRRMWLLVVLTVLGGLTLVFSLSGTDDKVLYAIGPLVTSYGAAREGVSIGAGAVLLFIIVSRLTPMRSLWRRPNLRYLRPVLTLLLLCGGAFLWVVRDTPDAQPLPIGPLPLTASGVWGLVSVLSVLLALYAFSLLLTMTTSPIALIEGLTLLLAPLRRLRLPVDDFALMMLLALRFIPTLLEEVEQLTQAQAARGADITHGTLRERFQSLTMLFVPLMQGVLRRASELATALEARGYESNGKQTRLHERSLGGIDYAVLVIVVLVMLGSLAF